ncbi:protein Spindly-like [Macrobrachium nipponense]|uniref:protein Spindly-like n=1 Tax=Macrobrachium nipponense TaxID=159736 RepID=UPI0030C7D5D0
MENTDTAQLKLRLEESERNLITAAKYGKLLLEENHELHVKLEETIKEYSMKLESLEQEKHAVSLKYETKVQNELALSNELDQLREQQESTVNSEVSRVTQALEKEAQRLNRKVTVVEEALEREQTENQQNKERIALLEAQVKEAQERLDISIQDQSADETSGALQSQILALVCEKQDLESQVSSLKAQVKTSNLKCSQAEKNVEALRKEVEDLECQSTSYFNALEQNKEEIMELKMEIEALKYGETDPGKKGNSLFAEVEDQRQAVEKQLQEYKSSYNLLKKQCEVKTQQVNKMKLQLANLLSLSSNRVDTEYLNHLEESLALARTQLEVLTKDSESLKAKQNEVVSPQVQRIQPVPEVAPTDDQHMTSFFKNLYTESQKKVEELEEALRGAQFNKVALSDRILQLQRKLRQSEATRDATNSKLIILQVKLDELAAKKGESVSNASKRVKQVTEKIPGFENLKNDVAKDTASEMDPRPPLLEKQIASNPLPEDTLKRKDDFCAGVENKNETDKLEVMQDNQENSSIMCSYDQKKKAKKSVRMTETVVVQEGNGEVQEAHLKRDEGIKPPQRTKVLRKMDAPLVKVSSGGQENECKQQ